VADEAWKPWPTDPRYLVSDQGRVRGPSGKIRKPDVDYNGRLRVGIAFSDTKMLRKRSIHKMVLKAFVGPCPPGQETRHRNGKHDDNRLENLLWGTSTENKADRDEHGRTQRGYGHYKAVLRPDEVMKIRAAYPAKTIAVLSGEYGVSWTTIRTIVTWRTWKHLP
jgi:hypothetical protein